MAENDSSEEKNVSLDKSELNIDRAREKVELDLDDAPFLDEEELPEEEEPQKIAEEKEKPAPSLEREKKALPGIWKNRKVQTSIAVLLILALLVSIFLFFMKDRSHPPDAPEEPEVSLEVKDEPEPEPDYEELIDFKPFMVELRDGEKIQFLYSKFSFPAQSEELAREINDKSIILRDSIYYYLHNQEAIFLRNKDNSDKIKNDILSVINQYLSTDRVEDLLIEEYLVK